MDVVINDKIISVFKGAKVRDAVRSYSMEEFQDVNKGEKIVVDHSGNQVSLGGELTQNQNIKIKKKT